MDAQGINDFLYSISRRFIQSPEQIRRFFVLIGVFLVVILLVFLLQRRRARLRHMRNAAGMYEHLVRQLGLSRSHAHKISGREVFFDHFDTLKRSERRRNYRRQVQIAVEVAPEGHPEEVVPALLADLSVGGKLLHLEFEGLSEAARDRVIGLVFGSSLQL